jgi:hypothetical protein
VLQGKPEEVQMQPTMVGYAVTVSLILALGLGVPPASAASTRHAHEANHAGRVTACGERTAHRYVWSGLGMGHNVLSKCRR